jgi:hypothetical protein
VTEVDSPHAIERESRLYRDREIDDETVSMRGCSSGEAVVVNRFRIKVTKSARASITERLGRVRQERRREDRKVNREQADFFQNGGIAPAFALK